MRVLSRLIVGAVVGCVSVVAMPAPAQAERRPTIVVAERAVTRAAQESQHMRDKARRIVDVVLAKNQRLASKPAARNRLFQTFNENNQKLQILNFNAQQNLARTQMVAQSRLGNLEPDFEADQMVQDAVTRAQNEVAGAFQSESRRLQQIFSPPPPDPAAAPEENGFPDSTPG